MKNGIIAAVLCFFSMTVSANEESPVKVNFGSEVVMGLNVMKVYVTAATDSLEIKKIQVNRGNCGDMEYGNPWRPVRLKFGQTMYRMFQNCNVIEISISTSMGDWTFRPGN